ncbi:hypothetical protein [Streptomyces sp. NPDC052496]|uniref:hypothetical protein n=1 Tax=Streptomyces sp. NPDC052496 TaxID=3154951 RepID=UPI00341FC3BC
MDRRRDLAKVARPTRAAGARSPIMARMDEDTHTHTTGPASDAARRTYDRTHDRERRQARLVLAGRAESAADLAMLIDALGLDPREDHDPSERRE